MLVLSRKADQKIIITCPDGSVITLMVIEIRGDKARLGIEAPRSHVVHRLEIHEAIEAGRTEQQPVV